MKVSEVQSYLAGLRRKHLNNEPENGHTHPKIHMVDGPDTEYTDGQPELR